MGRLFKYIISGMFLACCFLVYTPAGCYAKDTGFEAVVDRDKVSLGASVRLSLVFNNQQNLPAPELPAIEGIQMRYLGPSTMMSIVNGKVSGSVTHNYLLLPMKAGVFKLGPFKFEHDGNKYVSNQVTLEVAEGQVQQQQSTVSQPAAQRQYPGLKDLNDRLFVTAQAKKEKLYLNESVPLAVKLYVNKLGVRDIQYPEFGHEGFSVSAFDKPKQYQETLNGVVFDVIEFDTYIFGLRPGEYNLGPAGIKCNMIVRKQPQRRSPFGPDSAFDSGIFDDFFGRYETYPLELKSKDIVFTVLPLPQEGRPADFSGATGSFDFQASASPLEVKLGDPITLNMAVSGEGNFNTVGAPKLGSREYFKVYEAQAKQEAGEKKFEQIIMPLSLEAKEVPALSFCCFDPESGQYKTITRGPFPIKVVKPDKEEELKIVENRQEETPLVAPNEEKLGRDIVYIKDAPGPMMRKGEYLYKNKLFLFSQSIPLLLYLFIYILYKKMKRMKTDIKYARGLLAPRKAGLGLRQAKKYLEKGDAPRFYDTLFTTMQEYIGDKFHLSSKGITISVVDEELRKKDIPEEVLAKLRDIFRECDMARYASSQFTPDKMSAALRNLEEAIDYLQRRRV